MRRATLAVICAALISCGSHLVTVYGIESDPAEREFQPQAEDVAKMMAHNWVDRSLVGPSRDLFNQQIDAMPRPGIYWVLDYCKPEDERTGILYKKQCYAGLMFDWKHIIVADRDRIWKSAFMHEMGHAYAYLIKGDGDAAHADNVWWFYWEIAANFMLEKQESAYYGERNN